MKRLCLLAALCGFLSSARAAEWTQIDTAPNGTKWFAAESFELQGGLIRTWLKSQKRKKFGEPFAVLIDCANRQVRDYAPGELGSEFYIPWEPIKPDSVGEMAYNAFCKNHNKPQLSGFDEAGFKAEAKAEGYSDKEIIDFLNNKNGKENCMAKAPTETSVQLAISVCNKKFK